MKIRLATFDALYTILRPRHPIHIQYAEAFAPFFGHLHPDAVKSAFKSESSYEVGPLDYRFGSHAGAFMYLFRDRGNLSTVTALWPLKEVQSTRPAYAEGPESWWATVIARTAIGAGAREADVQEHLSTVVPQLLHRFSSREGYALYDDTVSTLQALRAMGIATALVSNADSRILKALEDLGALHLLDPVLASDLEGVEKPDKEIFLRACRHAGVQPGETLHVGDELECDYHGATHAGLRALLLCRPPDDPSHEEDFKTKSDDGVRRIKGLTDVMHSVQEINS